MGLLLYHNPRCSKSRQSLALLRERGVEPTIIEYLNTPPNQDELRTIIRALGIAPRELLRTKEKEYALAGLDRENVDDQTIIDAMTRYPKLIERPIALNNGKAAIGRPPENVLKVL